MSAQEVIHCPNCNEDVPKTLYCLNCGYPLYKLEQENLINGVINEKGEPSVFEKDVQDVNEVDMSVEYEPPTETFMAEKTGTTDEMEIEDTPEPTPEPEMEIEDTPEPTPEPEMEIEDTPEKSSVITHEPTIIEEREDYMLNDLKIEFAPDPLTKEVMDNLAKNITLKIRLIKLLQDNAVKEETFKKLFDSYVDQGRIWVNRRQEIIRRFKSDLDRMGDELVSARKDYELLEIRKNIGDAGDHEYNVKAPAYKWDIEHLDKEIKNSKGGIQYILQLQSLIPSEEIVELESFAQTNYSVLDNIEGISTETIAQMKETLSEALETIQS